MTNFKSISEAHSHNTRGGSHNCVITKDLSLSPSSFAYTAIKAWNSFPSSLKSIVTLSSFKRELKESFLSRYMD